MKFFVFITLFALAPFSLLAQNGRYEIGLGGGMNMTSLHGDDLKHYFDWQYSAVGSIQLKYSFSDALSLVGNISYESKGCKGEKMKLLDEEGNSLGSNHSFRFTYNYITVPLLFRYSSTRTPFFINAGPYMGYLLQYTESFDDLVVNRTSDMQNIDLGMSIGGGVSYHISDQWGISVELRNNLGLTNVRADNQTYLNAQVQPAVELSTVRTNSTNLLVMINYRL